MRRTRTMLYTHGSAPNNSMNCVSLARVCTHETEKISSEARLSSCNKNVKIKIQVHVCITDRVIHPEVFTY